MHSMQFRCKMRCISKDMLQCFFIGRRNPRLSLGSTVRADSDHLAWARVETDSCRGPLATLIAVVVTMGEPQQQCLDGEERVEARRRRAILSRNLSEKDTLGRNVSTWDMLSMHMRVLASLTASAVSVHAQGPSRSPPSFPSTCAPRRLKDRGKGRAFWCPGEPII